MMRLGSLLPRWIASTSTISVGFGKRSPVTVCAGVSICKQLHEAEGYLMLELPRHALAILESRSEWFGMQFEACFLKGEALRSLERPRAESDAGREQ